MKNVPHYPHDTFLLHNICFPNSLSVGWLFELPAEKKLSVFAAKTFILANSLNLCELCVSLREKNSLD
jgi:hypothetical protein